MKTGWPMPALMQDDDPKLFRWFAAKLDARRLVRASCARIAEALTTKKPLPAHAVNYHP